MKKAKKFLIFTNLVYLNIISKKINSDPLLSLVKSAGLIWHIGIQSIKLPVWTLRKPDIVGSKPTGSTFSIIFLIPTN